jgi:hypothetical protein
LLPSEPATGAPTFQTLTTSSHGLSSEGLASICVRHSVQNPAQCPGSVCSNSYNEVAPSPQRLLRSQLRHWTGGCVGISSSHSVKQWLSPNLCRATAHLSRELSRLHHRWTDECMNRCGARRNCPGPPEPAPVHGW